MSNQQEKSSDLGTLITVPSFPIKTSVLLYVVASLWVVLYYFIDPSYQPTVALAGAAAAGAGALVGAYYAGQMIHVQIRQHNQAIEQRNNDLAHEQRRAALRYSERWADPNLFAAKQVCKEIIELGYGINGPDDVCAYLNKDHINDTGEVLVSAKDKQINMRHVLNFLEEFAVAHETGVVDKEVSKRLFRGAFSVVCHATSKWRTEERVKRKMDKLWIEMDALNTKWQS